MTGQTCALPGCFKPLCPSVSPGKAPPLACGDFHHQLLMASRLNPDPYIAILLRNAAGLCALHSCAQPPHEDHSWCSRTHYLLWLTTEFTSSLHPEYQICMLPGCTRHVYVDENGPPSRFCGWRHKQEFVRRSALDQRRQQEPLPPSVVVPPQQPASLNESGHLPSLNSRLHSFKQFVISGTPPKNTSVIEDFYEKHPWEVFTGEGHACWLIACPKFTSKGRQLTTKGHYHWKQSGRHTKKNKCFVKYYAYTKRKGKGKEADQQHTECSYTMQEYTWEDDQSHSLICLLKEKPFSDRKLGKEKPSKHQIGDQVINACFQDTVNLSSGDDAMFGDNFLDEFLSVDDEDLHQYPRCADPYGSTDLLITIDRCLERGVSQGQVVLDMFTHGGGASFPFVFPYSAQQCELLQGRHQIPS